jgi:predicted transcriptional regulator of viral defense system
MSIPKNRNSIIALAKENGGIVTKKQVVEKLDHTYFCNGDDYLGAILSAMVKVGILKRVKNGVFELLKSPIKTEKKIHENQSKLF